MNDMVKAVLEALMRPPEENEELVYQLLKANYEQWWADLEQREALIRGNAWDYCLDTYLTWKAAFPTPDPEEERP